MADEKVDHFLEEEAAASRLVEELSKLRKETESYAVAGQALNEVSGKLTTLADEWARLAAATRDGVAKLNEIGIPQLHESNRELRQDVDALKREVATVGGRMMVIAALVLAFGIGGLMAAILV